ncbi:hypothetical protein D3C87_1687710 [compost metagenome]
MIELIFFHWRGWLGMATSGSSVFILERSPSLVKKSLCPSIPTASAIFAVPIFDEYWKISGTLSMRPLPWKSLIVKPPMRIGKRASNVLLRFILPSSRPIASVKDLKVEPISNVPFDIRLNHPSSPPAAGSFGSKSGAEAMPRISPV